VFSFFLPRDAVAMCQFIRLSVCHKPVYYHVITDSNFLKKKDVAEIRMTSPVAGTPNARGDGKICDSRQITNGVFKTIQRETRGFLYALHRTMTLPITTTNHATLWFSFIMLEWVKLGTWTLVHGQHKSMLDR